MPLDANSEKLLMRYLSGNVSASERDSIARRLASDNSYFAALEELETDWIDRYARGQLSDADALALRLYLEETGQEHRLAIASALHRETAALGPGVARHTVLSSPHLPTSPHAAGGISWLRFGAIAALLAVASMLLWHPAAPHRTGRPARSGEAVAVPFAIALPAGVVRGNSNTPVFRIPRATSHVLLRLQIPEGRRFPLYRVALLASGDQPAWQSTGPASSRQPAVVEATAPVPALAQPGRELVLYGLPSAGDEVLLSYYPFSIALAP